MKPPKPGGVTFWAVWRAVHEGRIPCRKKPRGARFWPRFVWSVLLSPQYRLYSRNQLKEQKLTAIRTRVARIPPPRLAYLAGFFDGEGCISIHGGKKWAPHVRLDVGNSNIAPLQLFEGAFGGSIRRYVLKNGKQFFNWTANPEVAAGVLEAFLPYLTVKKRQARIAVKLLLLPYMGRRAHPERRALIERLRSMQGRRPRSPGTARIKEGDRQSFSRE